MTTDQITKKLSQIPVTHIPLDQIKTDGKNPNRMNDELFQGLVQHIKDNGILNPIVVTEDMLLADGEHRLKAAKELGLETIPARIIPNDERLRRLIRQTMNKLRGHHDQDLDAEEFRALIDLEGINQLAGYLGEDTGDLLKILDKAITPKQDNPDDYDIDAALEAASKATITKPGDLVRMGDHILICGDSTDPETWNRLLEGQEAEIMITDPPYNVAYTGGTAKHLTIMNDNMPREKFRQFLLDFLKNAMQHVRGAQYIFMSSSEWTTLADAFEKAGGLWSTTIIWVKTHFVLSRKDFHPQYEPLFVGAIKELQKRKGAKASAQPIIYGWRKGSTRLHYDARVESDVWVAEKPSRNEQHPTMKPVTLYRKAILLSSRPLDIVVDPFCGSGSCVIACEQTHRKARVLELDPVYCDVIINRWEEYTGKKAERIHA